MTDLAANSTRMMEINNECDQLIKSNHMQSAVIKRRQKQLNEQLVPTYIVLPTVFHSVKSGSSVFVWQTTILLIQIIFKYYYL